MGTTTTTASTSYSSLHGVAEDGLVIFRGIPYARPRLGSSRNSWSIYVAPGERAVGAEVLGPDDCAAVHPSRLDPSSDS
jgi:carboxylesterase type B